MGSYMGITQQSDKNTQSMSALFFRPQSIDIAAKENKPKQQYAQQISKHISLSQQTNKTIQRQNFTKLLSPNGRVYFIQEHQASYQGLFKKGYPHGEGIAHFKDGSYYKGNFQKGQANGEGFFVDSNGSLYFGNFKQGLFEGFGAMKCQKNKFQYSGNWKNGYPEGDGEEIYPDGGHYRGQFKRGLKQGNGEYYWGNGKTYQGQFKNNKIQGKGVLKGKQGNIIFAGNFQNGMKIGQGVLNVEQGTFIGNFVDDYLEGKGVYVWPDGKVYTGQFKKSQLHGNGWMVFPNDKIIKGHWENNNRVSFSFLQKEKGVRQIFSNIQHELEIAQKIHGNVFQPNSRTFVSKTRIDKLMHRDDCL